MPTPEPEVLLSEETIHERVTELARQISSDYRGEGVEELYILGVLRGAFIFLADLSRQLTLQRRVDFIALSSYEDASTTSGAVRLILDVRAPLRGKHVLVVEDIVDSGLTLKYLLRNLAARNPLSLEVLALLSKPSSAQHELRVRYQGFEVPDVFVVGYGLDYAERYRNLDCIATLSPAVYSS